MLFDVELDCYSHGDDLTPTYSMLSWKVRPCTCGVGRRDQDIQEVDMFIREAETGETMRRRVTLLSWDAREYSIGDNFKKIEWAPQASIELLVELVP